MDVREAHRRSVSAWIARVEGVGDSWSPRTPCAAWDVRQLVNHVVGEDRWTVPLVEGRTIAEVGDTLDGDLLGADPLQAARTAADQATAAVDRRPLDGATVQLSYGEESLAEYLWQLTADHLVHGWDLAAATAQDRALDADLVHAVGAWFADREQLYRSAGAVSGRPEGALGGSPAADLLIAFGRDPAWSVNVG